MNSIRTITAALATTGLMAVAGAPAAMAQSSTTTDYPSDTSTQTSKPAGKKGHKGKKGARKLSDAQLTKVATALGTTLEALKAAQAKVKAATDATDAKETKAERDALLAPELGVTVTQLRTAFDSVRGTTDGKCKGKGSAPASSDYPSDTSGT